jgi:hypothetical protein
MQVLTYNPLTGFIVALFVLVSLVYAVDRLGLRLWLAWHTRHAHKPKHEESKQYWGLHQ